MGKISQKNKTQAKELAKTILHYSRRKMSEEMPELLSAVWALEDEESEAPIPMYTDGKKLFYHPQIVLEDYLADRKSVKRQLSHIMLHGLLGHFSKRCVGEDAAFDIAADLKVAQLEELIKGASIWYKLSPESRRLYFNSKEESLESCCMRLEEARPFDSVIRWAEPFRCDDHRLWTASRDNVGSDGSVSELWQEIVQHVLETMGGHANWGSIAGMLSEVYRDVEESTVSYTEFLQRFSEDAERQLVDPDSISRIWYHVGLEQTGNVPFIEPEELREHAKVLKLAVAIDTSGSCCGEVMEEFLSELLAVVRDGLIPGTVLYLIQCDAAIQSVREISAEDNVSDLLSEIRMQGGGGTDFRPVFHYLNQLECEGEDRFKGLLYFSDGFGDFPEKAPDYQTVFLFPRRDVYGFMPQVPDWITKVYITEDNRLKIEEEE